MTCSPGCRSLQHGLSFFLLSRTPQLTEGKTNLDVACQLRPLSRWGDHPRQVMGLQRLCFGVDPIDILGPQVGGYCASLRYGTLVGYVLTSRRFSPGRLTILSLAVHPEFRRQGIGRGLLELTKLEGRRYGLPLTMLVGRHNQPMRRLLAETEFTCCETRRGICHYVFEEISQHERGPLV